jgi:hypothetical protein
MDHHFLPALADFRLNWLGRDGNWGNAKGYKRQESKEDRTHATTLARLFVKSRVDFATCG